MGQSGPAPVSRGVLRQDFWHPNQVESRASKHEQPVDLFQPSQLHLTNPADALHPSERPFNQRPFSLTDLITSPSRRPRVDGAAARTIYVLTHMRSDLHRPHRRYEIS